MRLFYGDLTQAEEVSYIEEGSEGDHLPTAEATENPTAQKELNMATATPVHPPTNTEIFDFEGQNVRTVTIDNEPWFVLGDVCKVLDLPNVGMAKKRLDQADISSTDVWSEANNRNYSVAIVNESGLYDVILDSRKPQAKAFRRWITSEVIPSIRKTGSYSRQDLTQQFQLPTNYVEALRALVSAEEEREELTWENQQLAITNSTLVRTNEKLSPKAQAFDEWIDGEGVYLIGSAAKMIDQGRDITGQNRLFNFLFQQGILIKHGRRRRDPAQNYAKYFRVKGFSYEKPDGKIFSSRQTYVTPEGIDYIANRMRKAGYNV